MGVAKAEGQADRLPVAVEGAVGEGPVDERAELWERAYELGLRPPGQATVGELRALVARNELVELTAETRAAVLEYIREHPKCSLRDACSAARVRRADVRAVLKSDADFYEEHEVARGRGVEDIYDAVRRLAIEGVERPLVSAGKLVKDDNGELVVVREYSDRLVEMLYKARTPEGKALQAGKLGIEISGPDGGPVVVQRGIALGEVLAILEAAGKGRELEAPPAGEVIDESDELLP